MNWQSLTSQRASAGGTPSVDPLERLLPLLFRLAVLFVCAVLMVQALDSNATFPPSHRPLLYSLYSTLIILPMHEGGHFLFRLFGYVLYMFGGSFWQIMFPVLLAIVAIRQRSFWVSVWIILTGVHAIDLSPYIYDAPYQSLALLGGKHVLHDWHYLLIHYQALDWSEPLSDLAYYGGGALGIVGIGLGVVWAIALWRRTGAQSGDGSRMLAIRRSDTLPPVGPGSPADGRDEDSLSGQTGDGR